MDSYFKGKVAVITGSSMGIGKATALEFARRGASIVLNGRNKERLQQTAQWLRQQGHNVLAVAGDVSVYEDCEQLIAQSIQHFGRIDILINNAGKSSRGYFYELSPVVFKDMMDINVLGCLYPTRCALPHLEKSSGSITFISSVAGIRGLPETSLYCASKMALTSIAESLKVELHEKNIHVGIVYVGITENEPGKTVINADGSLLELQGRDNRRVQKPSQVALSIVKHVRKRRFKTILTALGKLNWLANLLIPRIVDQVLVKSMARIRKMNQ